MDSTALLDLFRSDVRDEATPPLWSDVEIYSYMDDAQKMFCRLQGGIADATSAVTQIDVTTGQPFADVSPLILKLRYLMRADGRELPILNFEDLQSRGSSSDYGQQWLPRIDSTPGSLEAAVVGMEVNKIRLIRVPEEDQTLSAIVYRMPLVTITTVGAQTLEIDEQHHTYLLHWMKYRAHLKQDAETYDKGRSDMFKASFMEYCDQCKAERERREHKYRSIVYGGI